jgi:hypothetical protein
MILDILRFHDTYIGQIAVEVIVIESVANDELVGDAKDAIVGLYRYLGCSLFV